MAECEFFEAVNDEGRTIFEHRCPGWDGPIARWDGVQELVDEVRPIIADELKKHAHAVVRG